MYADRKIHIFGFQLGWLALFQFLGIFFHLEGLDNWIKVTIHHLIKVEIFDVAFQTVICNSVLWPVVGSDLI